MTDTNKIQPNTNRSSLYKDVSHLRALSSITPNQIEDDELEGVISMKNYLKWVGVLSLISLLIGFCTAAITH